MTRALGDSPYRISFSHPEMPAPRMQLRWVEGVKLDPEASATEWYCIYEIVIAIDALDVRADEFCQKHEYLKSDARPLEAAVEFGRTRKWGDWSPIGVGGCVRTPFRDGAHVKWDARQLGLPAFAVYGDDFTEIETEPSALVERGLRRRDG